MRDCCPKCSGELFVSDKETSEKLNVPMVVFCVSCFWNVPIPVWKTYCEVVNE